MTETNSGQIAAEQESSTSLNNAVRELQHIRARILELEDQQTTNAPTSNTVGQAELEDGELSNSSVSTWSGTSDGSSTSSPPHRRVRFASPPAIPLPLPPPALVEPRGDRTLVETSRRFRQPFRALHRMPTVRIIPPTQNHPPSFRTPFNTGQHRIVLPTQRPPFRLPTPPPSFTHPPPRTVPPPHLTSPPSPTFPFPPPVLNQYNITQTNATNYFR